MLRKAFETAAQQDLIDRNPAKLVSNLARTDKHERRPFTQQELSALLSIAEGDWRAAILMGYYTGLRLGDVQDLVWTQLDLKAEQLSIKTRKTKRMVIIPLAATLTTFLRSINADGSSQGPLCPTFQGKRVEKLSLEFHALLVKAALVERRDYRNHKGDGKRRQYAGLSFHCLRHNTTSALKNTGATSAVAGDIVGHDSEAMSRNYTKIDMDAKKAAVDRLPDILGE